MTLKRLATCFTPLIVLCIASTSGAQEMEKYRQLLASAKLDIAVKAWGKAAKTLDSLLNEPKDVAIEASINKKTIKSTVHAEAERLLKSMPPAGREWYEKLFGDKAQALLKAAEMDEKKLQFVSRTKAGADGTESLAAGQFDAGRAKDAVKTYARLLDARPLDKLTPPTLYRAARACRDAGVNSYLYAFWMELRRQAPQGFRDGDRFISHEESEQELQQPKKD
jgi:hypothetical protein